jgi:cellulose biosynthesis protein BcsQ
MKQFIFNIQSKGGAGKSMLTYLQALKHEDNDKVLFVDLDNSTKTSLKQLQFLSAKKRIAEVSINDNKKRIDREKLFAVIEKLASLEAFDTIFIDFGAPESQQFPSLFNLDFSAEELKDFEESLQARFVFNIIVAGGASYLSCMEFTREVAESLRGLFDINIWLNEYSFSNYANQEFNFIVTDNQKVRI